MSIGTDQGEVLIPTVINNRVVSDEEAIRHYRQTGENFGVFRTPDEATAYAKSLHAYHEGLLNAERSRPEPVSDGVSALQGIFPNARVTSSYRDADHPLSKANPRSWHTRSHAAVDIAPIPGMTFAQAKQAIQAQGYGLVEAIDEVNHPSKNATGPHWHFVLGKGR